MKVVEGVQISYLRGDCPYLRPFSSPRTPKNLKKPTNFNFFAKKCIIDEGCPNKLPWG